MAFVLAACGGETDEEEPQPATSSAATIEERPAVPARAEQLVGTWSRIGGRMLVEFSRDGTFAVDTSNLEAPFAGGTYEVRRGTITFTSRSFSCQDTWAWKATVTQAEDPLDDELHILVATGACGAADGEKWSLARISR
jgi:hypothetical protein